MSSTTKHFISHRTQDILAVALVVSAMIGGFCGQAGNAPITPPPAAAAPGANIVCYSDSLTAGGYLNGLQRLYPDRKMLTYAIGGEGRSIFAAIESLTEAFWIVPPGKRYVRIELASSSGKIAWSNPIYFPR